MIKFCFVCVFAGAMVTAGCSKFSRSHGGSTTGAARDPSSPVARLGGQVITEGELAAVTKGPLARLEAEQAEKIHQTKAQALDGIVDQRLLETRAKKEGLTPEKLLEREVTSKIPAPADAEIQTVYDRTKASGRPLPPFDQVKGEIANFIKERNAEGAKKAFTDKLRSEAKVEILLPPVLLPKIEVAAEGPSKGTENAPVTIIEFSDYQCPFCSRSEEVVKKVLDQYKGKVRLVFRQFPLPFHSEAEKASEAALCAADQGKYWEMHDKLFSSQSALAVPQLKEHAKGIGLDAGKFDKCLDAGEKAKMVEASKKAGDQAGVTGTPAFFINGRPLSGAQPFEKFKEIIDYELAGG